MKTITKTFLPILIALTFFSCQDGTKVGEPLVTSSDTDNSSINSEANKPSNPTETVVVKNQYSIEMPEFMTEVTTLNNEASFQCQNIYKETYMIVIDEPTDEFISVFKSLDGYDESLSVVENYRIVQSNYINEDMSVERMSEPKKFKINGLDAEQIEIEGTAPGINAKLYYLYTFVEGEDNVYMIMAWTLKDRKDKYAKVLEEISNSIKLVEKKDDVAESTEN
ncbi:MAG: hypothetical protein WED10_06730 [Brumimicrobium sp.]